jgi:hypothetical protein
MSEEEKSHWVGMAPEVFDLMAPRLSQSLRDRLLHLRRLAAAGLGGVAGAGPAQSSVQQLANRLIGAKQAAEKAAVAAESAVKHLGECSRRVKDLEAKLEVAKAEAAKALAPSGPPVVFNQADALVQALEASVQELFKGLLEKSGAASAGVDQAAVVKEGLAGFATRATEVVQRLSKEHSGASSSQPPHGQAVPGGATGSLGGGSPSPPVGAQVPGAGADGGGDPEASTASDAAMGGEDDGSYAQGLAVLSERGKGQGKQAFRPQQAQPY